MMGAILDHLIQDHGATQVEAEAALKGWHIQPIVDNGRDVGEIMLKENEVHVALIPEKRLRLGRAKLIKRVLDELLMEREFLVTRLFLHDQLHRLLVFIGFRQIRTDGKYRYYWMDEETRNARA